MLAAWLVPVVLLGFPHAFPMFDDWVYAWSAFRLAGEGVVDLPEWTSALPLAQVVWGALFVELFGASQAVLRAATLVAALIGNLCWYRALRLLGLGSEASAWAVALVVLNPAYFVLSATYMTDVPFVATCQVAVLAGVAWTRRPTWSRMVLATLAALAAAMVRQPGAALLVGLVLAAVRLRTGQVVVPVTAAAAVLVVQSGFGSAFGRGLPMTARMADVAAAFAVSPAFYLEGSAVALAFLGLCAAPAAVAAGRFDGRLLLAVVALLGGAWLLWGEPTLRTGTVWGACELGGARSLLAGLPERCAWGPIARAAAAAASALGWAALAPACVSTFRLGPAATGHVRAARVFLTASVCTLSLGMVALWLFADRYWLVPALLVPAVVLTTGIARPRAGMAVLGLYAVVAIAGTRDVFHFYADVNFAADRLVAGGIAPEQIDAGYAVNGWRRYLALPAAEAGQGRNHGIAWVTGVDPSPYTIANRAEPGWVAVEAWGSSRVVVQHRTESSIDQPASSGLGSGGRFE